MSDVFLKRGDRLPEFSATLSRKDGGALGFVEEDVATVRFLMGQPGTGEPKVDATIDADDWSIDSVANTLTVTYAWAAADTDTAGTYTAEIEIQLVDGRRITFPNTAGPALRVVISPDLG